MLGAVLGAVLFGVGRQLLSIYLSTAAVVSAYGAAGSLVVYPSSSIHAVLPVTRGERRACFLFIQSLVRDAEQRRLLFDLDMELLALRQELGETASMVRLSGIYHNLLRRWGDA